MGAVALLLIAIGAAVAPAHADGMFVLPADLMVTHRGSSAAQKAVLVREGQEEVLLLQTTYRGPASRFAWIIPVPAPPSDVFVAEPGFLKEIFERTEPRLHTDLRTRTRFPTLTFAATAPAGPHGGPGVRVLRQMEVGPFAAAVVQAVDGSRLQRWLVKNGYAWPDEGAAVLTDYTRRGWTLVALKMKMTGAPGQEVLKDVPPVGIRFACPAGKMIYPLAISRLSAPAQTALIICLVADEPYVCATFPTYFLDRRQRLPRGKTYGDLRREATAGPRALCEASRSGVLPFPDLNYRETPPPAGLCRAHVTRHFMLLCPDQMQDLAFRAAPEDPHRDYQLLIRRTGTVNVRALAAVDMAVLLTARELGDEHGRRWYGHKLTKGPAWPGPISDLVTGSVVAILLVFVIALFRSRDCSSLGCFALAALLAVLPHLMAIAGAPQRRYLAAAERTDTLVAAVDKAAATFRDDTGAYPRTVADLAATSPPATGLDASGNEVALTSGWRGPYLSAVPPAPMTRGAWRMDPLNAQFVDDTGLRASVEPVTHERLLKIMPGEKWGERSREYWKNTPGGARVPYFRR